MADIRVGIVGCGNIGGEVCAFVQRGGVPAEITALTDIDEDRAHQLLAKFELNARVCTLEENAALGDYLVECAAA